MSWIVPFVDDARDYPQVVERMNPHFLVVDTSTGEGAALVKKKHRSIEGDAPGDASGLTGGDPRRRPLPKLKAPPDANAGAALEGAQRLCAGD